MPLFNKILVSENLYAWDNGWLYFWLTLSILLVLFALLTYTFFKVCRRKSAFISLGIMLVLSIVCFIFNLYILEIILAAIFTAIITVCLFCNLGDLRAYLASPFKKTAAKAANFGVEKIYNREALYKKIETTVIALSKSKTGAIMTFEKNTSLNDIIKNGVPIHAPVSPELLQTIFYEGTRLHDGAVVIHGNEIVAASVFFTPTTKPFAGKYGSRHRAAIGISEISDAVTVVVSEETGRISFAVNGELESVDQSIFLRVFENYMSESSSPTQKEEQLSILFYYMDSKYIYDYLIKVQSITKIGLLYSKDPYAITNYTEINNLTKSLLEDFENVKFDRPNYFKREIYPTPNVSVRTVILNDDRTKVLMVREAGTGTYSLPGGWADLYDSPSQAAKNECSQEAGADVDIIRLVGITNRTPFKSSASIPEYVIIFEGKIIGELHEHEYETDGVGWFDINELPPISRKTSQEELLRMIVAARDNKTIFD